MGVVSESKTIGNDASFFIIRCVGAVTGSLLLVASSSRALKACSGFWAADRTECSELLVHNVV
jgi:hypothetical protein